MVDWTPQQLAFFDFLDNSDESCILKAAAGTGKTTTLVEGVKHLRGSVLAVAFNVKIKTELEKRIGKDAYCKTMNGLGHRALVNMMGRRVSIDQNKSFKIMKSIFEEDEDLPKKFWGPAQQLLSRAKHVGIVPKGTPGRWISHLEDTDENWEELAAHHDIDCNPSIIALARLALRKSNSKSWKCECDFDDQIYVPCCWDAQFQRFDNVIVDEAQDLSIMQHLIVKKSVKSTGRVIAAGDEFQAIYGWRAAASDSIPRLIETFNLEELDLTVSFRCGRRIIEEAQKIVPRIEARPNAHEGSVSWGGLVVDASFEQGDVVLCRNNGPLIDTAYKLIREGIPCFVLGRDIGKGLKNLITKLQKLDLIETADELLASADTWKTVELNRLHNIGKFHQMQSVADKVDSLIAIIAGSGARTIPEVELQIDRLFSKTSGKVTLSTVHKAKGLEWKRVFFLDENLIPSIWAMKAYEQDPARYEWMMQEEENIRYVAVTRAIEKLTYVKSKEKQEW